MIKTYWNLPSVYYIKPSSERLDKFCAENKNRIERKKKTFNKITAQIICVALCYWFNKNIRNLYGFRIMNHKAKLYETNMHSALWAKSNQ